MPSLRIQDLRPEEIDALVRCNSVSEIIGIQVNEKGGARITRIARSEVTCWQLILRIFGFGKFANTDLHLNNVVAHLNEYDWKVAGQQGADTNIYRAYLKVCSLANSALACKDNETLYDNVCQKYGDSLVNVPITLHGEKFSGYTVKWNPALKYKHIVDHVKGKYHYCTRVTVEEDRSFSVPGGESEVQKKDIFFIKINLG